MHAKRGVLWTGLDWIGKANSCMLRKSKHVLMITTTADMQISRSSFLGFMIIGLGLLVVHECTAGFYFLCL